MKEYTFDDLLEYYKDDPMMEFRLIYNKAHHPLTKEPYLSISKQVPYSLHMVLNQSFVWQDTPEGAEYWGDVFTELKTVDN